MTRQVRVEIVGDDRLTRTLRHSETSVGRFGARLARFGVGAARVVGGVGVAFGGLAAAGAALGVKTAAGLEQADIAFTQLLGSGKKAQSFLARLKSFAARTPFELPGLIDSARGLLGVGVEADKVIPILRDLGDAAGALGLDQERFQRVQLAVTQSMAKGKVQAEELMQITEAGIPVWQLLSKALGKPVPELQKLVSQGKLAADDVFPKLFDQMHKDYGGSMAKQSQTLAGLWSTFTDTISIGLADAIKPLEGELKTGLKGAIRVASDALQGISGFLTDTFVPGLRTVKKWWDDNKTSVADLADNLKTLFTPAADDAAGSIDDLKGKLGGVKPILDGILEAVAQVEKLFYELARAAGNVAKWILNVGIAAGYVVNALDRLRGGSGHAADSLIDDMRDMRDKTETQLDKVREALRKTQNTIDRLEGKDIPVTASLGLKFTKDFPATEWVRVRQLAGRMQTGGRVGGQGPRGRDNQLRWLAPDEHVWTEKEVIAAGGHQAMQRWRRAVLGGDVPELARGGPVGRIDREAGAVNRVQARGTGMVMDQGLTELLRRFATARPPHAPGGWQVAVDYLRRLGVAFDVISTFRPGARTHATGRLSYHALNRAVDLAGGNMLRIFEALARTNPTELIYSGASRYKSRRGWSPIGRLDPVTLADHWSHVHAAYGDGGIATRPTLALVGEKGPEAIVPLRGGTRAAIDYNRLAAAIVRAMNGVEVKMDTRKVGELVTPAVRSTMRSIQQHEGIPYPQRLR